MEAMRAVLLGILVQAAANVNNTYWDFVNGVDTATVLCLPSVICWKSHVAVQPAGLRPYARNVIHGRWEAALTHQS